jgi:ElaB/YqjD/DUF883 family membrane-anchored ribosome-binding protein
MNSETATSQNPFPTSTESGLNGSGSDTKALHNFAQKIHEAVDTLEQRIGTSSEKVMTMQQEYGDMAREQVRANPLAAIGASFVVGFILAKLL